MRFLALAFVLALAACADAPDADPAVEAPDAPRTVLVGDAVPDGGLPAAQVAAATDSLDGQTLVVTGSVTKVCQQAGCWMTFETDGAQPMRINVPRDDEDNYVFTFPRDVEGYRARVAGTVSVEEESVDILRHYAEDEGASAEAIAAITEPRRTLTLEATGAELTNEPLSSMPPTSMPGSGA